MGVRKCFRGEEVEKDSLRGAKVKVACACASPPWGAVHRFTQTRARYDTHTHARACLTIYPNAHTLLSLQFDPWWARAARAVVKYAF